MRFPIATGCAVVVACVLAACGGGSSGNPNGPSPPAGGASTISILGDRGAQSFSPNPGTPGVNQTVMWRNNDTVVHRIVSNDGTFDTGDIAPGATTRAIQPASAGTNYHCSIHPGMIGAVNASGGAPPPPCQGTYC
jgi:plastocyanin